MKRIKDKYIDIVKSRVDMGHLKKRVYSLLQ